MSDWHLEHDPLIEEEPIGSRYEDPALDAAGVGELSHRELELLNEPTGYEEEQPLGDGNEDPYSGRRFND